MIRRWRGAAVFALAALISGLLLSCATPKSPATPSVAASKSGSVSYRTRADALAAAKSVYLSYVQLSSDISQHNGDGVERLKAVLTESAYAKEQESVAAIAAQGLRTVGSPTLVAFREQAVTLSSGDVSAYACVDFSKVHVENKAGKDVTPSARTPEQTSNPTFTIEDGRLLLAEDKTWSGESVC